MQHSAMATAHLTNRNKVGAKNKKGCAPHAAENNFILGAGGANVQQHFREIHQHLSDDSSEYAAAQSG